MIDGIDDDGYIWKSRDEVGFDGLLKNKSKVGVGTHVKISWGKVNKSKKAKNLYDAVIKEVRAEGAQQLRECLNQRDELIDKLGDQIEDNAKAVATALMKQDLALSKLDEGLSEIRMHRQIRREK